MEEPRVLFVDDDENLLMGLKRRLRGSPMSRKCASDTITTRPCRLTARPVVKSEMSCKRTSKARMWILPS